MEREAYSPFEFAEIAQVHPGSIADECGIQAGEFLLALNGKPVLDIFDFRSKEREENILLTIGAQDGAVVEYEIEKDEDELLGLEFVNPLLSDCESCDNHCLFCFIDQLPPGMRSSLYFKDDDSRLSFLTGNYVTLTNLTDEELDRIISYRFSPLNISVHATDTALRRKLLGNRKAGELLPRLERIAKAGIKINAQFVLCPQINDGSALDQSIEDLVNTCGDALASIALVPVGLTKWREENRLYKLKGYEAEDAKKVLDQVQLWQKRLHQKLGRRLVYAADEFYLLADLDFPRAEEYEDYPQLENGVGMSRVFLDELLEALEQDDSFMKPELTRDVGRSYPQNGRLHLASSVLGAKVIGRYLPLLQKRFNRELLLSTITNQLFGESITVTGLLVGKDIIEQMSPKMREGDMILICDSMLRGDENIFLDDTGLEELSDKLSCRLAACGQGGGEFFSALLALEKEE